MKHQVRYAKRPAEATPAAGVRGVVCKSAVDERYFFRVYAEDHTFVDYELRHDDLTVTIAAAGEDVVISKHGQPVARLTQVQAPRQPIDFQRLRALTERLPEQVESAESWMRAVREQARY